MEKKNATRSNTQTRQKQQPFFQKKGKGDFFSPKTELKSSVRERRSHDPYEAEADRAADLLTSQKKDTVQLNPLSRQISTRIQRKADTAEMSESSMQMKEENIRRETLQKKDDEEIAQTDQDTQLKKEHVQHLKEEKRIQTTKNEESADSEMAQEKPKPQTKEKEAQAKEENKVQPKEEKAGQAKEHEESSVPQTESQYQAENEQEPSTHDNSEYQAKEEELPTQTREEETKTSKEVQRKVQDGEKETEYQAKVEELPTQTKEEETQTKKEVQRKAEDKGEESEIQSKSATPNVAPPLYSVLNKAGSRGNPLSDSIRPHLEAGFGVDFSEVRVHTDATAAEMSTALGAQAFTRGKDVYFNNGKFDPASVKGLHLLAHELTHTIQQGAVKPKPPAEAPPALPANQESLAPEAKIAVEKPEKVEPAVLPPPEMGTETEAPEQGETTAPTPEDAASETLQQQISPRSPEEDPNFQALKSRADDAAKQQKSHEPSQSLSHSAQAAAPSPPNERTSMAEAEQVETMNEQEPAAFDAKVFKELLLKRIADILPQNEEKADEFAENNQMGEVQAAASKKVKEERNKSAGAIESATSQEPNTANIPERKTEPLQMPRTGPKPPSLNAGQAMPSARTEQEVNQPLQDNVQEVENRMAQENVTEEQLAKSEEPKFLSALEARNAAREHSKTAPSEFRKQEEGVRSDAQNKAQKNADGQFVNIFGKRTDILSKVIGTQNQTGNKDTAKRQEISTDINKIYENTKKDVDGILGKLDGFVERRFYDGELDARGLFEGYIAAKMLVYKYKRYSGFKGNLRAVGDFFTGLPPEVNEFFVQGRNFYISKMDVLLTDISNVVANKLNEAKKRIKTGRDEVKTYVDKLPKNLKSIGAKAAKDIQDKFGELDTTVNSKQEELIDSLAEKYNESVKDVDERILEMKEANRGLYDKAKDALDGVFETIRKLKEAIENLMGAIRSVIPVILADPIAFMGKLFDGIGEGIDLFKANIKKHLLGGLLTWLTGALGPIGIQIPENIFSLPGIFDLVTQILGVGWDFIRTKAVRMLGEPVVAALEKGFEIFQLIREKGILGLWEYVQAQFTDLKTVVIDAIQDMLITKVIEAGIKWLLSLLIPGAGFIKAIMAIKDVIVFFVESAIMLIPAITEAILALASGSMARVAKAMEKGLSTLIPLVIGLFARLIGIGSLAKKVQAIIKKIRKRIDKAVNKLLAKAKKWARKLIKKGKGIYAKGKEKVKKGVGKLLGWWKIKIPFKTTDGKSHKIYFEGKGPNAQLVRASDAPKELVDYLTSLNIPEGTPEAGKKAEALSISKHIKLIIRTPGKSGQATSAKQEKDITKNMTKLSKLLIKLVGKTVSDVPDPTECTFTNSSGKKRAQWEKMSYKTAKGGQGASGTSREYNLMKGKEGNWVRMHLISAALGGKGGIENWVVAPTRINTGGSVLSSFEKSAERLIRSEAIPKSSGVRERPKRPKLPNVLWMDVEVKENHPPHPSYNNLSEFPKLIRLRFGIYLPPKPGIDDKNAWEKVDRNLSYQAVKIPPPKP